MVYNNLNGNTRDRVYGNLRLKYDILKGLFLQIRSGLDVIFGQENDASCRNSQSFFNGYYQEDDVSFMEINNDFLLSYRLPDEAVRNFGFSISLAKYDEPDIQATGGHCTGTDYSRGIQPDK